RRMGAEVALVEGAPSVLAREAERVGEAVGAALRNEGVELVLGARASGASVEDGSYVLRFEGRDELRGDRLLLAPGRRPRVRGVGLEHYGVEPGPHGLLVDARMRAGEGVWAIGDATDGPAFTHVAKYGGRIAAADILGRPARADLTAVPRVVFTDP